MRIPFLAILSFVTVVCQCIAQSNAPRVKSIYSFTDIDGDLPTSLIEKNGSLYGMITAPGAAIFQLTPPTAAGSGWTESVLYSFTEMFGPYDAQGPLTAASDGSFFGTSAYGGTNCEGGFPGGCGTVFQVSPVASSPGTWSGSVLYNFTGNEVICNPKCPAADGSYPLGTLIPGPSGVFYGVTALNGSNLLGSVFELIPPNSSGGGWTEMPIYAFTGKNGDGAFPGAGLIMDRKGALYGTTQAGGITSAQFPSGGGTVFRLIPPSTPGGSWTEEVLYSFAGSGDGVLPHSDLTFGLNGRLYGTTQYGGAGTCAATRTTSAGCGTAFELTPPATVGGTWTESVLFSFPGGGGGKYPSGGLSLAASGALYGTTYNGGDVSACTGGCGTVFRLTPPAMAGGNWSHEVLHRFAKSDGANPSCDLLRTASGAMFGTTLYGGGANAGTVFEVIP